MTKNKDAKARTKLPKKVGGVKVPKKLRKVGAKLVAKATSPLGLELIATGLSLAAAAADAAVKQAREKRTQSATDGSATDTGEAATRARGGRSGRPPQASNDPHEIGVALGRMAEAALAGLLKPKA